ncbi:putative 2-keto-4-pentenoate hydratase-like protein [Rhizobium favelukesii]|uniref:2-keto-4-pentenoate hydratase-like protein n=1 Tax=Rhizobium favelukesii TaxID=348824 RepID=W6R4A0_9HYPH|nr:putative 2-keto-4-pentenoate hydratase-like protein [Rhizobium favelukesii]
MPETGATVRSSARSNLLGGRGIRHSGNCRGFARGFERKGYALVGSRESRRILGLTKPVVSEIRASALIMGIKQFRLPPGAIGAQCEFVFSILATFPPRQAKRLTGHRWRAP